MNFYLSLSLIYSTVYESDWKNLLCKSYATLENILIDHSGWFLLFLSVAIIAITVVVLIKPIQKIGFRYFSRFPYSHKHFVGRDKDVEKLMDLLDFSNKSIRIINVIGTPGIGKSTLAIHAVNKMIANGTFAYYVNMAEFPEGELKLFLAEKILPLDSLSTAYISKNAAYYDELLTWADHQYWNNVILLDNSDGCINSQRDTFKEAIEEILQNSDNTIKIVITSRETMPYMDSYYTHVSLMPLSKNASCELLELKIPFALNQTEKKAIAKLTGKLPLALQIIGSLLRVTVDHPPSPSQIIAELKNPIHTLSPPKLDRKMQQNASMSLSYNYLSKKLQKIGRYLAHFPASFDKSTACGVLRLISRQSDEYFSSQINELVTRSLLELDEQSGRYHFHRLLKEFFLTHTTLSEARKFNLFFQGYFAAKLHEMNSLYMSSPKKALAMLDIDRHNLQYFMTTIQYPVNQTHSYYVEAIVSFALALKSGYLSCRFSPEELIGPVRSATSVHQVMLTKILHPNHALAYFELITNLASLTKILEGKEQVVKQYLKRINIVEELGDSIPGLDVPYTTFYAQLLSYESELDEESVRLYHMRILKKVKELHDVISHKDNIFDYGHIGLLYYVKNDHKQCVFFLEKALSNEENTYSLMDKVYIFRSLLFSHYQLHNDSRVEELKDKLLDLFDSMVNQTSSIILSNMKVYQEYYLFFIDIGDFNRLSIIQEKMIESMYELGKKSDYGIAKEAYRIAKDMYERSDFNRSIIMASYALRFIEDIYEESMIHNYIGIRMVLGKAQYTSQNYSEANSLFIGTLDLITQKNLINDYKHDYTECCLYLIYLRNFGYVQRCFLSYPRKFIQYVIFLTFTIPFEKENTSVNIAELFTVKSLPIELYPKIIHHSKSKDVLHDDHKNLALLNEDILLILKFNYNSIFTTIRDRLISIIMKHDLVRFLLNVMSILIRLYVLYYVMYYPVKIFLCCCFKFVSCIYSFTVVIYSILYMLYLLYSPYY